MSKKVLVIGRTTTPKVISEKMTVVSLAKGEKESTSFKEIKLIGRALETFKSHDYGKGTSLAMYCEEETEHFTSNGEEREKTVFKAQSIYTPILAAAQKVIAEGKQFIAGHLTTPKVISPKMTVVRVAVGVTDPPEFKEVKLTGDSLAAFNEAGVGKGMFIAFSVNPSTDKFTPKTGENAGQEVSKTVYFAKSLFAPVFALAPAGTDQDVPF